MREACRWCLRKNSLERRKDKGWLKVPTVRTGWRGSALPDWPCDCGKPLPQGLGVLIWTDSNPWWLGLPGYLLRTCPSYKGMRKANVSGCVFSHLENPELFSSLSLTSQGLFPSLPCQTIPKSICARPPPQEDMSIVTSSSTGNQQHLMITCRVSGALLCRSWLLTLMIWIHSINEETEAGRSYINPRSCGNYRFWIWTWTDQLLTPALCCT